MKVLTRTLSLLTIAALTLFLVNCGSDDKETPRQQTELAKFSKTWSLHSATLSGDGDRTDDFTNFQLKISGSFNSSNPDGPYDYQVTGTLPDPSPWKKGTGKWRYENFGASEILVSRDPGTADAIGMSYSIGSDGRLTIKLNVSGSGWPGGKIAKVEGDWTFIFQ